MTVDFSKAKATQQQPKQPQPRGTTGTIVKPVAIPALKALESQLDRQTKELETQARQLVRSKMVDAKVAVSTAVADELATIAGADDFFDFGLMFNSVPTNQVTEQEADQNTAAIDVEVMLED